MAYHKVPDRSEYDVVVIGGGMAGLSAAVRLAQRGASVLVVEAHYRPGGYAHAFRRGKFLFDCAVHLTPGGGKGELFHSLLDEWGVADTVEFLPVQPMYRTVGPGLETFIRSGREDFIESHAQYFPKEREGFRTLVDAMQRINREIRALATMDVPGSQMMRVMVRYCPTVLRYSSKSLQRLLDEHLTDPVAKSVVSTLWTYLGLPPSQCSAVAFSAMLMAFVDENAYYVKGSFQRLADAFVLALGKYGGEMVMPRRVERILLDEQGRVNGVRLDKDGEEIRAKYIISASDATQTFLRLVGREHLDPDFAGSIDARPISTSAFEVFLGVKLDLKSMGVPHETFFAPSHDPDEVYAQHTSGIPFGCGLSVPTVEDDTLVPPGHHALCITMFAPFDKAWRDEKDRVADALIDQAERLIPGLCQSIVCREVGTPWTMERYTGNSQGALYGWDNSPKSLATRLSMETPVPGLFLAGHWTRPGGGLYAVVLSGQIAAKKVCQALEQSAN